MLRLTDSLATQPDDANTQRLVARATAILAELSGASYADARNVLDYVAGAIGVAAVIPPAME